MAFDKDFKQIEKNESLNKMIHAFYKGYESRYYQEEKNPEAVYPFNTTIAEEFIRIYKLEGVINVKEVCRRFVNFTMNLEEYPFDC